MHGRSLLIAALALSLPTLARAQAEEPQFSRNVVAVLSKLGCNGGACHGAVKGQNGFRLALFGADPVFDHERLVHEFGGRRLNRHNPDASLLLLKATGQVSHDGGKRTEVGSPEYTLLRKWIASGAKLDVPEKSRLAKLTVTPAKHTAKPGESYKLAVKATFLDGSSGDGPGPC